MSDMFKKCGLIYQIESYVSSLATSSFSWKAHETTHFLERLENKQDEILTSTNWIQFCEQNTPIALTAKIENEIRRLFSSLSKPLGNVKGTNEWVHWLLNVDHMLSHHLYKGEGLKEINNDKFQIILEYYRFLRGKVEKRGFLIPEPFNVKPIERFMKNMEKNKPQKLPKCKYCKSDKVKKWSKFRFRCNNCGRTFSHKS